MINLVVNAFLFKNLRNVPTGKYVRLSIFFFYLSYTPSGVYSGKYFYASLLASCPQAASMSFPRLLLTFTTTPIFSRAFI